MNRWQAALHHGFIEGIAHRSTGDITPLARDLATLRVRLGGLPLFVHATLGQCDTGGGPFVAWGNARRGDPDWKPLLDLLLSTLSGPWISALGDPDWVEIEPSILEYPDWLQELIQILVHHRSMGQPPALGLAAFGGGTGSHVPELRGREVTVPVWRTLDELERTLVAEPGPRTTREVLDEASAQLGELVVVLPSARRAADSWTLDCRPSELHLAILGLHHLIEAMNEGMPREDAVNRYHQRTTIPMSGETGDVARSPNRRRQREFVAGTHGKQYFDLHAKPGDLTRLHVWVGMEGGQRRVYIGHCGKHLT